MIGVFWFSRRANKAVKDSTIVENSSSYREFDAPTNDYYKPRYEIEGNAIAAELDGSNENA
jgi:hypothetical protein